MKFKLHNFLVACLICVVTVASAADAPISAPPIAARAYLLYDMLSEQTLVAQSAEDRFDPASLTKLMTAYIVFDAIKQKKLDVKQNVVVSERAWKAEGSRMFIEPKKAVSVEELLKGMIVQSGNDASIALAETVSGTEEAFVMRMNDVAAKLGLTNTSYTNATGLPNPKHYSSPRDLMVLTSRLIRDFPEFYALYATRDYTYNNITQPNRNRLLWLDPNVDGVKTGHTEAAGFCLIASAKRGERRLLSVLLGAASESLRISESQKLMNFGFQALETRKLQAKDQAIAEPDVFKGTQNKVKLGIQRDFYVTLPPERFNDLKATAEYQQPLIAPYTKGQKVGTLKFMRGTNLVTEVPLVSLEDVPVAGFLARGWDSIRLLFKK